MNGIAQKQIKDFLVIDSTAEASNPNAIVSADRHTIFTNRGTTGENNHELPPAEAGLEIMLYCADTDGIKATAQTGDTIRLATTLSISGGFVSSTEEGAFLRLICMDDSEWIAASIVGTWLVEIS